MIEMDAPISFRRAANALTLCWQTVIPSSIIGKETLKNALDSVLIISRQSLWDIAHELP
jgi:hypothetical protein